MDNSKRKTILIADDHPMFRSGVRAELDQEGNLDVIAEAGDGQTALRLINELNPDVAILDFQMPGLSGLQIATELQKSGSAVKTILLTMFNDKKILLKAVETGVRGYVLKNDAVSDIVHAVNCVTEGGEFVSAKLTGYLLEKVRSANQEGIIPELINRLTPTEKNILKLISELESNEEIAERLFISKRTVENQKVLISQKLDLKGAKDLLKFAVKNKNFLKEQ